MTNPNNNPLQSNQNADSQIDAKSLSYIEDMLSHEAMAYKKYQVYGGYFNDSALKTMANNCAMHHKQHFDALQTYMNTHR